MFGVLSLAIFSSPTFSWWSHLLTPLVDICQCTLCPDLFTELQIHISNGTLSIPTWMLNHFQGWINYLSSQNICLSCFCLFSYLLIFDLDFFYSVFHTISLHLQSNLHGVGIVFLFCFLISWISLVFSNPITTMPTWVTVISSEDYCHRFLIGWLHFKLSPCLTVINCYP